MKSFKRMLVSLPLLFFILIAGIYLFFAWLFFGTDKVDQINQSPFDDVIQTLIDWPEK